MLVCSSHPLWAVLFMLFIYVMLFIDVYIYINEYIDAYEHIYLYAPELGGGALTHRTLHLLDIFSMQ